MVSTLSLGVLLCLWLRLRLADSGLNLSGLVHEGADKLFGDSCPPLQ